jgi:hypothetical protein
MTGTIANPATFAEVIVSPKVIPGDTIIMRGGTYTGDWIILVGGTLAKPVIFKAYEGETVTIQGGLHLQKPYTTWQNITIQQPDANKLPVYCAVPGMRLVDCDISGGHIGINWFYNGAGALVRCNIHHTASYGMYTHNDGGLREITDCVFSDIGGYYSLHFYSESENHIHDYLISGCTVDKPVIVHGSDVANVSFIGNTFNSWLKIGNGYSADDVRQVLVSGNTFAGMGSGVTGFSWSDLEIVDNTFAIVTDQSTGQQTNIFLLAGENEQRTVIDRNAYTDGDFNLENEIITFAVWQAAGYDANGTYQ